VSAAHRRSSGNNWLRLRGDRGVAAIEFALLFTVMAVVAGLMFPVGQLYLDKIRLGRAAGDALRFATAAPNSPAYGSSGRRPSVSDIQNEAVRAYIADGGSGLSPSDVQVTTSALPGGTVTIHISKTDDIGPVGNLLAVAHATSSSSITVSVDASGREE